MMSDQDQPAQPDQRPEPEGVEFLPLAEPFQAPNGLVVSFPMSVDELMALGEHFRNALMNRAAATFYAKVPGPPASAKSHVYQVGRDGVAMSCGEIEATGDAIAMRWDRARDNRPGTPETQAAIDAFVDAVNAGAVELNYVVAGNGFEPQAEAPIP